MNDSMDLDNFEPVARIVVIGVGGAGTNAVNRMMDEHIDNVDFYVLNTDKQALATSKAPNRIVIGEAYRGKGLGRRLYLGAFDRAMFCGVDMVTAEIDTVPYNETSLAFHKAMGFEEVGQQVIRGGKVQVSLQVKKAGEPDRSSC
jgi:GNAT superfamily N-acetyltransferase